MVSSCNADFQISLDHWMGSEIMLNIRSLLFLLCYKDKDRGRVSVNKKWFTWNTFLTWLNKTSRSIFSINFPKCPGLFLSSVHTLCHGYLLSTNQAFSYLKGHTEKNEHARWDSCLRNSPVGYLRFWSAYQV